MKPLRLLSLLTAVAYCLIAASVAIFISQGRSTFQSYLPKLVADSLPNFAATALSPLILIFLKRKYTFSRYVKFVIAMFLGMSLYEVVQIWMPSRTFDWTDIAASFLGAALAALAGLVLPFPFLAPSNIKQATAADS
jgi:VanZ family protein